MAKIIVDYRDYVREAMKAFDEGRVLLVSHGKEGLSKDVERDVVEK